MAPRASELIEFRRAFVWLLCAVLLPSVALVAFGVVAVANERAAVERRLTDEYGGKLKQLERELAERLDAAGRAAALRRPDALLGETLPADAPDALALQATPDELQALASPRRDTIDIVAFVPEHAVDPVYHDKAYYLVPERRGAKPYALLLEALRQSHRRAIAKWAWRGKETIVEVRAAEGGLTLQQLRYVDEVRRIEDLQVELEPVGRAELALALALVEQNAEARFDPERWVNEEQARIRAAIEHKVAGQRIVESEPPRVGESAQVIDLMQALRASLRRGLDESAAPAASRDLDATARRDVDEPDERKPARRAPPPPDKPARRAKSGDAGAAPPSPTAKRRSTR